MILSPIHTNLCAFYSAGGGGKKSKPRMEKIKQKNKKLNEERANKMKKEKAEKNSEPAKEETAQEQADREMDSIHPSRRGIVPHKR